MTDLERRRPLAIYFSEAAFSETLLTKSREIGRPQGLVGREVANRSMLSAILRHKTSNRTTVLLEAEADRTAATAICHAALHDAPQSQHVRLVPPGDLSGWIAGEPGGVVMFGQPPDADLAHLRADVAPHAFALCGVAHTMATPAAIAAIRQLVEARCCVYDTLICPSAAVLRSVQVVIKDCRERQAELGLPMSEGPTLELIPLGVDTQIHRPASPAQRHNVRRRLGIGSEDFVVLFVGRLSHHAKAQPMPLLLAAQKAAESCKRRVVLVQCGWFANESIRRAYVQGAAQFAPAVQTVFVDGLDDYWRHCVWHAADCFVSLADSVQETFGLTPIEAMARRLPVLVSDWDGYRDCAQAGETALTVPTLMHSADNGQAAERLVRGEITYDRFLAELSQRVVVDVTVAGEQLVRLASDAALRDRLAEAGYRQAVQKYAWPVVISQYEQLWQRCETQRREAFEAAKRTIAADRGGDRATRAHRSVTRMADPAVAYPDIRELFGLYPSSWIDDSAQLVRGETSVTLLPTLAGHGLSGHCSDSRLQDIGELQRLLHAADGKTLAEVVGARPSTQVQQLARASVLWLLKYSFLRCSTNEPAGRPLISFITTCMGRLDDLRETLPRLLAQPDCEVIVVDYSCPQRSGRWVREHFPSVRVVEVPGKMSFHRSAAKNAGIPLASGQYIGFIDADILLGEQFVEQIRPLLGPDTALKRQGAGQGVGGTFFASAEAVRAVGGHDLTFEGWGEEDDDLLQALKFHGLTVKSFARDLIVHREHDDAVRTQFHEVRDRRHSHMINRVYRTAKWDWAAIRGSPLNESDRQALYARIREKILPWLEGGHATEIVIDTGRMLWNPFQTHARRQLRYTLGIRDDSHPQER